MGRKISSRAKFLRNNVPAMIAFGFHRVCRLSLMLGWACVWCGCVSSLVLAAQNQLATLVLVTNHQDAAIIPLLRSELESLGLTVETVDKGRDEVIPRDLQRAAREHHAVAAIRVLASSGIVELWIADRVTGKVVLRDVLSQGAETKVSESTVALQVVELLRASLLEVAAPHPPRGEVVPPPTLYNVVGFPDAAGQLRLELAPAVAASVGGASPLAAAAFEIGYRVSPYWTGEGFGLVSVVPGNIRGRIGTAKVQAHVFTLGIEAHPRASATPWQPFGRFGAGLASVSSRGDANSPYVGYQRDDTDLVFSAAVGSRYRLTRNVALSATLQALRVLHPIAMQFNAETVAHFGALVGIFNLGIVVSVP